jgi:phosphinothricin acetyltransferase
MTIDINTMTDGDWESVREMYAQGIATGLATFETEVPSWEQWNTAHHESCRLVACADGKIVGWVALSPVSKRHCYRGVAEVSVYVREGFRHQGIGRQLLEAIITESEQHGIWTLQGGTFAHNEASLKLQYSCGFRVIGYRERIGQLNGRWLDTVLTERRSSVVGFEDESRMLPRQNVNSRSEECHANTRVFRHPLEHD